MNVELAKDPQELIEDIADLLSEIGFDYSFLDYDELRRRGMKNEAWTVMSNGILRPGTQQGALFINNLNQLNEQKELLKK